MTDCHVMWHREWAEHTRRPTAKTWPGSWGKSLGLA